MWVRRGHKLLLRCFQACSAQGENALLFRGQAAAGGLYGSSIGQWGSRQYSVGQIWEVPHPAASVRHELCLELSTARALLPNRDNFSPQFTPHGVQLMPHSRMTRMQQQKIAPAAEGQEVPVLADSVKRKRRMKIKKHKFKKRMKKLRHQVK